MDRIIKNVTDALSLIAYPEKLTQYRSTKESDAVESMNRAKEYSANLAAACSRYF